MENHEWRHTSCVRLSCYREDYRSAFLILLFLAQSASYCGSCSQKSHSPHPQCRGSLSPQEDISKSHGNPVFEILQVCVSHFSFVQTSVEPLTVWSSFLFLSTQHNTFHQHLFPEVPFTFACSSEEIQSLLASET